MLNIRGETLENMGGNRQGPGDTVLYHLCLMQIVILQSFTHLFLIHLHWTSALCAIIFLVESVFGCPLERIKYALTSTIIHMKSHSL